MRPNTPSFINSFPYPQTMPSALPSPSSFPHLVNASDNPSSKWCSCAAFAFSVYCGRSPCNGVWGHSGSCFPWDEGFGLGFLLFQLPSSAKELSTFPVVKDGNWLLCPQTCKRADFLLTWAFSGLPENPTYLHTESQARRCCHAGWWFASRL